MRKNKLLFFWLISMSLYNPCLFAQQPDSVINIYSERFPLEKLHLHFDRSVYSKGETIWFKAYLMTGSKASDLSKTFYADWYDATGKLVAHNSFPVFGASAKGQFEIPADYALSSLHLRAYTKWMLNFDSSFLYDKDIVVSQPQSQKPSKIIPATEIHFFPEGGDLVDGLNAKIGFLTTNQNGDPVSVHGAIKNSKNELIDSFATEHDGMGVIIIDKINADELYTAYFIDEYGKAVTTVLPGVKKNGVVMQSQPFNSKVKILIARSAAKTENNKTLYLLAHMNQQVLYKAKINLENRVSALTEVNTTEFSSGVLQLTLFNSLWQPVAERIVFVNNHQYQFDAAINTIKKDLTKRNKNIIEVEVPDSAVANLSIAVTDEGLTREESTIVSQFLLSDDIKGKIIHPSFYFQNDEDSTKHFLDLVMLTHGWRRFKWDEVAQAKLPVIKNARDSDYIELTGTVSGKAFRASDKDFITLILSAANAGKQIIPVQVNEDGTFSKTGLVFFDTIKVYYSFKQKNLADRVDMDLHTNFFSMPGSYIKSIDRHPFLPLDSEGFTRERFFTDEQKRLQKLMEGTTLKNVTVYSNSKPKTSLDIVNDKYTSGAFAGDSKYRADIMSDPQAQHYQSILNYLKDRVAGFDVLNVQNPPSMVTPTSPGTFIDVRLRGERPAIYINDVLSDIDEIAGMPMSEITYVKVFSAPFFGAWQNGPGGAIAVYTRKGDEELSSLRSRDNGLLLTGYTKYKEFFSPAYSDSTKNFAPDVRTTLYWDPYILTNAKNHKVQLEFYNNDISKKLRIVLEGMNADGKLTRVEKVIE